MYTILKRQEIIYKQYLINRIVYLNKLLIIPLKYQVCKLQRLDFFTNIKITNTINKYVKQELS